MQTINSVDHSVIFNFIGNKHMKQFGIDNRSRVGKLKQINKIHDLKAYQVYRYFIDE